MNNRGQSFTEYIVFRGKENRKRLKQYQGSVKQIKSQEVCKCL